MKKSLAIILSILMLASLFALSGCGEKPAATLKFGSAVYVGTPTATDASADKEGEGAVDVTVAAVSVDADGKIVAVALDTMQSAVKYTTDGRAIGNPEAKTKRELGFEYNMVKYGKGKALDGGDVKKEWFEQVDFLEDIIVGKTLDQVKALVVNNYRGTDEVINAGCTIGINDLVLAVEKAYNSAAESTVTAADTLKVSAYTVQEIADATADKDGSNKVSVYTFAAAVNAESKVVAAASDCVEVDFTFDTAGKTTFDVTKEIKSKKELGDEYNMVKYGKGKALDGGDVKNEWYVQAAAFDSQCIGKTGAEIAGLMGNDGRGVESVQTAGCTIYVNGFVKAASKI